MEDLQYPGLHQICLMHLKGQMTFLSLQISPRIVCPTKRFRKHPGAWQTDHPHVVHYYSMLLPPYLSLSSGCHTLNLNLNSISSKRAHSILHTNVLQLYPVLGPTVWKTVVLLKHILTSNTVDLTKTTPWKHLGLVIQFLCQDIASSPDMILENSGHWC